MILSRAQIEVLAALHVMQPTTVNALLTYLGQIPTNGCSALIELVRLGLVERYKWSPPEIAITENMRAGFEPMPVGKFGKRPYLYQLTPATETAGKYLHLALQSITETIE
jgi:hypothetical protein